MILLFSILFEGEDLSGEEFEVFQEYYNDLLGKVRKGRTENELENACKNAKKILTVEMSMGQMVMDIKLYSGHKVSDVDFYGEPGGVIPSVDVIIEKVKNYV